jgi:hypothetical protein
MTPTEINTECARRIGLKTPYWRCPNHGDIHEAHVQDGKCQSCNWEVTSRGPNFHGSMDAAMQLVDKAKEWGFSVTMDNWGCTEIVWSADFFQDMNTPSDSRAEEKTPSAAICAAFLEIPMP